VQAADGILKSGAGRTGDYGGASRLIDYGICGRLAAIQYQRAEDGIGSPEIVDRSGIAG
jgi:hypothetical protein